VSSVHVATGNDAQVSAPRKLLRLMPNLESASAVGLSRLAYVLMLLLMAALGLAVVIHLANISIVFYSHWPAMTAGIAPIKIL
jgi:hypothetical protein